MKKGIVIILVVVLVIGLLAFLRPKPANPGAQKKDMGKGMNAPSPVNVYVLTPKTLENKIQVSGTVLANEEVDLRPEASGKVTNISFKEGSQVSKGDLLLKINDLDLQAQLMKLEYQKKLSEENEFRLHKLLEVQALSQQEYDQAMNQLNTIKADVQLAKAQIAKTEIRAPFDGTIGLKYVSEGSFVSPTTQIASLQDINPVKIDFSIPEKYMSDVQKGDLIEFSVPGSNETFKGTVYAIEAKIDPLTRTAHIRAIYENTDHKVYPGSYAAVQLIMKEINNALMIPTQALIPELKGQKVFLCKNGKAFSQKVEIGLRTENEVQVIKGIAAGDSVITTGIMQLKPDAPVKILKK